MRNLCRVATVHDQPLPIPEDNRILFFARDRELYGFLSNQAKDPAAAKALLAYLTGPEAAVVYKQRGMEPGH